MIKLNRKDYEDKVYACWLGKNIGGTIGTPYEGKRELLDVKGFKTEPGNPLPNDDLDLQLIWLKAMREVGPNKLDAKVLGEYWMDFIVPFWNEYGIGKSNMMHGIPAPMCGQYKNEWKHSNGAWIRTEIWATLYPACIEQAIKYAYYDACVDHGIGEGTFAAIFVAALESAAFVISDIRELIKIGLSKIPSDCRFYKFIVTACNCYDEGKTWKEAREIILEMALADEELGGWFQAPANVAFAVIGLLYGEGDFKNSILIAVNCGDDTDCTGATVGSILGIIGGTAGVPKDWQEYIGDSIITVSVNKGACRVPATCTELTQQVINTNNLTMWGWVPAVITTGETEIPEEDVQKFYGDSFVKTLVSRSPYHVEQDFPLSTIVVEYDREPDVKPGDEINIKVTVTRKMASQKHYSARLLLPEGWTYSGPSYINCSRKSPATPVSHTFKVTVGEKVDCKNRGVVEVTCDGRADVGLVPLIFFGA